MLLFTCILHVLNSKKKKKKFTTIVSHWDFSHEEIQVVFPRESQLQQSRATSSVIHITLEKFVPNLVRTGFSTCRWMFNVCKPISTWGLGFYAYRMI